MMDELMFEERHEQDIHCFTFAREDVFPRVLGYLRDLQNDVEFHGDEAARHAEHYEYLASVESDRRQDTAIARLNAAHHVLSILGMEDLFFDGSEVKEAIS